MHRSSLLKILLSLLYSFNYFLSAGAAATNRTIDDSLGDSVTGVRPKYLPTTSGVWEDQTCSGCAIRPSTSLAFKGTWTAATYNSGLKSMSIELDFTGTAIYVFFILANYVAPGITTETACNFTLDGAHAGFFNHTPSLSTDLQYNALVFSNNNLQNTDHKLIIETNDVDHDVFVNFDYAIYTFEDTVASSPAPLPGSTTTTTGGTSTSSSTTTTGSSSTSSSSTTSSAPSSTGVAGGGNSGGNSGSNNGNSSGDGSSSGGNTGTSNGASTNNNHTNIAAIAGGTVGGIIALAALIFALLLCLRRKKNYAIDNESPSNGNMFTPLNHTNDSGAALGRRNVPPPLMMDQHQSRPITTVTHSDFIQSGTLYPTPFPLSPIASSSGSEAPYGGIVENYQPPHHSSRSLRKPPVGVVGAVAPTEFGSASEASSMPSLAPVRRPSESIATLSASSEETRRARQQELEAQLAAVKAEMRTLKGDVDRKSSVRTRRNPSQDQEIQNMRDQMKVMSDQIQLLRGQQSSQWAQGLSDEPPPGYTPSFAVRNN